MAYNREWDRGKDSWNDSGSWNEYQNRGNVRGRDEEYYGEGKRRKYNNGVRGACVRPIDDLMFLTICAGV